MKNQRNDSDMSLNQKNRVKQEKEWNGGNEKNTNVYQKMSFFQYLSMYAFWVMCNVGTLLIAIGISVLIWGENVNLSSSMVFLLVIGLELLLLLIIAMLKKIKSIRGYLFLLLNFLGVVCFFFVLQPQSLRDWMIVMLFSSVVSPFCMEIFNLIKEMRILYDLTVDAKENIDKVVKSSKSKKE